MASSQVATTPGGIATRALALLLVVVAAPIPVAADTPTVLIELAHNTPREQLAKQTLEQVLASYDLKKFTFTRKVIIEQGAVNHAFPTLTLNAGFAASPDQLLSTYVHEQLHWHLRNRDAQQRAAIAELRNLYPRVPVGLPASAETEYSTYGHLVDCYLEIAADRELLGPERTDAVIRAKPWYTWIYKTVLADEKLIAAIVDRHQLRVP
jgi:hypothetical protein